MEEKQGKDAVIIHDEKFPTISLEESIKLQTTLIQIYKPKPMFSPGTGMDIGTKTRYVLDVRARIVAYIKDSSGKYTKLVLEPEKLKESSLGIIISEEIKVDDVDTLLEKIKSFRK